MVPTVPTSTPLYRILVLPASSPSADGKMMVISGPSRRIRVTATRTPSAAATIGIIHTSESLNRRGRTILDDSAEGSDERPSAIVNLGSLRRTSVCDAGV